MIVIFENNRKADMLNIIKFINYLSMCCLIICLTSCHKVEQPPAPAVLTPDFDCNHQSVVRSTNCDATYDNN